MTLNQADEQLAQWHDKLALIEENLRSFVQLPMFERLSSKGPEQFRGQTRQQAATALEIFQSLQQQQAVLLQTFGQAKSQRDAMKRMMPSKQTLAEIDHLLTGKSIQLAATPTPPEKRELLRDVEQAEWITPTRLLEIMLDSFRFVRDTVLAIGAAQEQARQAVINGDAAIARLCAASDSLGGLAASQLTEATQSLADLTSVTSEDPLGAQSQAEVFLRLLRKISAQVDGAGRQRDEIHGKLAGAQSQLKQLRDAIDHARPLRVERELKVEAPSRGLLTPPSDEELSALIAWLTKLQSTVEKNEYEPAAIGLGKWFGAADELLSRARQCADADAAALRDRRDLRGLFESLQAQAANTGNAKVAALSNMAGDILQLLAQRPTPLHRAKELVAQYQHKLHE